MTELERGSAMAKKGNDGDCWSSPQTKNHKMMNGNDRVGMAFGNDEVGKIR
ncbi:MAG: hypothetical protein LBV16_06550 [Elusimicrobiota bacterium]|jgi:hypothetical protein|nr:hypothetical protein [Elusimicrobiota bacterium]